MRNNEMILKLLRKLCRKKCTVLRKHQKSSNPGTKRENCFKSRHSFQIFKNGNRNI